MDYKEILSSKYNRESWQKLFHDIFRSKVKLNSNPYEVEVSGQLAKQALCLGMVEISPIESIAIYEVELLDSVNITRNRRGIRDMLTSDWRNNGFVGAFILSYRQNESILRFSYVSETWGFNEQGEYQRNYTATKRYTYLLGEGRSCRTAAQQFTKLSNSKLTLTDITEAFSVEALSKEFYTRLYGWYEWALSEEAGITFPNNPQTSEDVREDLNIKLIRLLTRLLFVWFIKQKELVPDDLFSPSFLKGILKDFDKNSMSDGCYYNAILQNLFFATLNCAIYDENKMARSFSSGKPRDIKNRYRYAEMFSIPKDKILELFARIPFLNGGLFECLDYPHELYKKLDHDILYDGFSRNSTQLNGFYKYRAFIPNKLFFNEDENQPGLITLLKEYNFTIEENSRDDAEVSLDPELLGQVFENLLAAYNPETRESARKSTGSFYTPRVIVDYMVDESLIAYMKTEKVDGVTEESLRELFRAHTKDPSWTNDTIDALTKALKEVKILDPACGSGAFPMGCLLRIVDVIEILNDNAINRYSLKLDIIENCIFGIDIQSIAMMICKLRFFISLICDQENIDFSEPKENFGINTLPNLETKFVASNTLLSADIRKFENGSGNLLPNDETLTEMKDELLRIRNEHFTARSRSIKKKAQDADEEIREKIYNYIVESASKPNDEKIANLEKELEKCEKELESIKNGDQLIQTQVVEQESLFGEKTKVIVDLKDKRIKEKLRQIQSIKDDISREKNKSIIQGFEAAVKQLTDWNPYDQNSVSPFFDAEWMFGTIEGFDIVLGNPPYISARGLSDSDRSAYEKEFGFSDDTYNLFSFKGLSLCKDNGTLTYIIPKTFWTIQTKLNMRELLLSNSIEYIFDTANPFEAAMVDTCIIQIRKFPLKENHHIRFFDGTKSLTSPIAFEPIKQSMYVNAQNKVIFEPTELNLRIYNLYNDKVKTLYEKWWEKIKTSREIERNKVELKKYRENLRPGDVTLLGCLTEGGQGLATANNGKYIAVRRSTKWASNIVSSRPKKLRDAIKKYKIKLPILKNYVNENEFLSSLSEKEIAQLFDSLKKKYGRDIFGQGYIYKIIDDDEMADVDKLSMKEKENGIDASKKYYVPYDKGDKDGNRWYLETPFAIAWSKENVRFLKTNSGKKGEGMPVVRNSQFFFREGLCWSDISDKRIRCRIKGNGIYDVKSMSIFSISDLPNEFIVCVINSILMGHYIKTFINNTVSFQINDARQIPIVIPSKAQVLEAVKYVREAINIKKFNKEDETSIELIQEQVDGLILSLYCIT